MDSAAARRGARVWQDDALSAAQRVFDLHFETHPPLARVLDAGAGEEMPLHIPAGAHLVALDISPKLLERNPNADEKILGDIQTYRFPDGTFDAAICWWVLEHVPRPEAAIERLAASLRTGGLLLVGVPYVWGFKALATKATPYRFHLWMARRIDPEAGLNGKGPFPTFMRLGIAPRRLRRTADRHSLTVMWEQTHTMNPEERLPPPLPWIWRAAGRAVKTVTLGRYNPLLSEYAVIFAKQ
jgi:SAM-dependent methyltransferase